MLRNYSAAVYDHLMPFSIARERGPGHQDDLVALGQAICQYGLHARVGVALLHQHFQIAANERLIEQFGEDKSRIRPQEPDPAQNIQPYLWQADLNAQGWYPLEFCRPTTKTRVFDMARHEVFLQTMAEILTDLKLAEVFGLTWLHRDFIALGAHEVLVETTDETARTLTWSAQPGTAFGPRELTPTTWRFDYDVEIAATHRCGHCYHQG